MNNMFTLARSIALPHDKRNYWFGAAGIRKDGTIVVARNLPVTERFIRAHAETRVARKGAKEIWVVRVSRLTGQIMASHPCKHCMREMKQRGVKVIHYMNNFGEQITEKLT